MQKRGFSMVELIIVVAVIAVLASIIMPKFIGARDKSSMEGCKANLKAVAIAMELYSNDNRGNYYPPGAPNYIYPYYATGCYLIPDYLKKAPVCPTGPNSQGYSYAISHDQANLPANVSFSVYCYPRPGGSPWLSSHNGSPICRPSYYSNGTFKEK